MTLAMTSDIQSLLADKAEQLLSFDAPKISRDRLHLPGPDFVDRVLAQSDRNNRVLGNLAWLYNHGRLGGTGDYGQRAVTRSERVCYGCQYAALQRQSASGLSARPGFEP